MKSPNADLPHNVIALIVWVLLVTLFGLGHLFAWLLG